jgi:hypothetical protein
MYRFIISGTVHPQSSRHDRSVMDRSNLIKRIKTGGVFYDSNINMI